MTKPEDGENIARLMVAAHAQRVRSNIEFMNVTPVDQLKNWYLKSFSEDDFSPVHIYDYLSVPRQLGNLYRDLKPKVQSNMRIALTQAVGLWQFEEHGNEALKGMAYASAEIGAEGAVTHFIRVIDDRKIIGEMEDEQVADTWRFVLGAVGRFAPSDEIEKAARRWLYDLSFPPRFLAQVLTILTICQPSEYPAHLTRFLEVEREHPDFYHLEFVLASVVRHAGVQTIAEHLHELEAKSLLKFLKAFRSERVQKIAELSEDSLGIRDKETDKVYFFRPDTPEQETLIQSVVRKVLSEQ